MSELVETVTSWYKVELFVATEEDFPSKPTDFLNWLVNGTGAKFIADVSVRRARVTWDEPDD